MRAQVPVLLISMLVACSPPPKAVTSLMAAQDALTRIQAIPQADPSKFSGVRDMKAWRNPYLIVTKDGTSLLDMSNNEQRPLKDDAVLAALAALPDSAWPYGRVVAVREDAATNDNDKVALRRSRGVLAGTLESAKILINWVPST